MALRPLSGAFARYAIAGDQLPSSFDTLLDVGGCNTINPNSREQRKIEMLQETWGVSDKKGPLPRRITLNSNHSEYNSDRKANLKAHAGELPFKDTSFDVVTCIDTLEHISPEERKGVISECIRVARKRMILVCPIGSHENNLFEHDLIEMFQEAELPVSPSLLEHRKLGLPLQDLLEYEAEFSGFPWSLTHHGNLLAYRLFYQKQIELIKELEASTISLDIQRGLIAELSDQLAQIIYKMDIIPMDPNYMRRARLVVFKNGDTRQRNDSRIESLTPDLIACSSIFTTVLQNFRASLPINL